MGGFPALLLLLALPGSRMSGEDLQVFLQAEGESFRATCSYDMHKSLHKIKFWCKELSEKSCPVLALSSPLTERMNLSHALRRSVDLTDTGRGWISVIMRALRRDDSGIYQCGMWGDLQNILLQRIQMVVSAEGRTEMMNDFSRKMIRVWLKKLQFNDSGEYHLESHFQGRNKPLKRIMLEVLGENWNPDADLEAISFPTKKWGTAKPTDDSNKDQRNLYGLMVLSSFLTTTALIATVILLATTYIRRKRAVFQKDRRNKTSRMPDGELKDNAVYAVIRHQPQLKPEDVIYVNTQPSPKVFFHLQEPPGNSVSSGPVEYATIIFRATTSQSGTEKKQTGPPKQSSTKPWAYS
ncbi:trem-like transcript 1 protein isoform X2 [Apteryx mantelli]|uniref:Trem-like transcript 1 protein isoform X2 n=1 Tax=Apteryx mantelli TaxID=2696672 RepID=A0ABM4FP27_9AVES